jgi:hypothetical protein
VGRIGTDIGLRGDCVVCDWGRYVFGPSASTAAVRNGEFLASPTHHKSVILSGALHTSVARNSACSAKSKDPEGAYLTDAARSFLTTETAAIQARFTLKSAAIFICGSCEIWGFGGRKALSSAGNISAAEVLRLRATSTVSRDRCVKRSAQDDDFVGISRKTAESDRWATPIIFGPRTLGRTWGTRRLPQMSFSRSTKCKPARSGLPRRLSL